MTTTFRRRIYRWYLKARRFVLVNILHADDSPHRLALGFAIGMWVAFTPTYGLQLVLTPLLSWWARANKTIGLIPVWITNPATVVPAYYLCYKIGSYAVGRDPGDNDFDAMAAALQNPELTFLTKVTQFWSFVGSIFLELWIGCLFVATLLALISYYVVKGSIVWYRMRKWGCTEVKMPLPGAQKKSRLKLKSKSSKKKKKDKSAEASGDAGAPPAKPGRKRPGNSAAPANP